MKKVVYKTIFESHISVSEVQVVDKQPTFKELEPIKVLGKVSEAKAERVAKSAYGKDVIVTDIQVTETRYKLPLETFLELAEIVKPEEQDESEEE